MTQEELIDQILERNKRVELDKAWERSFTRRFTLAVITYITAVILLWSLGSAEYFLQACIPAIAYIFSTLSLPWLRKMWMRHLLSER